MKRPLCKSAPAVFAAAVALAAAGRGESRISAGGDWAPLEYRRTVKDGTALDFSSMPFRDAPAGKHGWLRNANGRFEFERLPGRTQRFCGANVCGTSTAPPREAAARIVDAFRKAGYNAMRLHQAGKFIARGDGSLVADAMDRFDFLFAEAKKSGIYVTTDLYVNRVVDWRDIGFDRDGTVGMQTFKGLCLVHEPAFLNWLAFARAFMEHVNPYTGLRYAEDPALPLVVLVNEGMFAWGRAMFDMDVTRRAWREWLAERRAADPSFRREAPEDCAGLNALDESQPVRWALRDFIRDKEARFAERAVRELRGMGVKAMLSDWNCTPWPVASVVTGALDYVDMHFYADHPSFPVNRWKLPAKMGNSGPDRARRSFVIWPGRIARAAGKPYSVSEWNFTAPNECRGAGGLMAGCCADALDWGCLMRFDYLGQETGLDDGSSSMSYFAVRYDPFMAASERASVLVFMRREFGAAEYPEPGGFPVSIEDGTGRFAVSSGLTAGGFCRAGGAIRAGGFDCRVSGCHAAAWASSLDGRPLRSSDRILFTHLTDCKQDGMAFEDGTQKLLLEWGAAGRPLVRRGTAEVSLAADAPDDLEVFALETDGTRAGRLPVRISGGALSFTASVEGPDGMARFLYEIVRSR